MATGVAVGVVGAHIDIKALLLTLEESTQDQILALLGPGVEPVLQHRVIHDDHVASGHKLLTRRSPALISRAVRGFG